MAQLRITSCVYQPLADRYMLTVDCFYPNELDQEDRVYLIIASSHDISTSDKMKTFIENDILLQRSASPNWVGEMWKSTRV
jgi:hypothetical protein